MLTEASVRTMCSAVLTGPRRVEVRSVPIPEPGPDEVRVRLEGCGLCASSLPLWQGRPWFDYPRRTGEPGHEGWGVVDEVGGNVRQFAQGDRVAMISHSAFAEYDIAPERAVAPLPPEFDGLTFPGEALGCVMNIFERSGIREGQTIAIIGIGFLGAALVQLASPKNRVIAVSRRPFSLDVAESMGARACFALNDPAAASAIDAVTDGRGCDCVIEATGHQSALDLATEIVAERGRIVIAGYHQDGLRQVNMQQWNWKGVDVINAHERDAAQYVRGIVAAAAAVNSGSLDPAPLCSHRLPLDRIDEAFRLLEGRPDGFIKAVVIP